MDDMHSRVRITVTKDGPYLVTGSVPLTIQTIGTDGEGQSIDWVEGKSFEPSATCALCRCGHSQNAPYCDGHHITVRFQGTETASHEPYEVQKQSFQGSGLTLDDARALCAGARFCDAVVDAWTSVEHADDPVARERVLHQAACCPSGRLVAVDKSTGGAIEPKLEPSIGVVEDPSAGCSGPLWVRGGIELQSQGGEAYEVRNRVTLCRCGQSSNKPFCDGTHAEIAYKDGIA